MIEHELRLIAELDYARYFLTVHGIVRFAREKGILAQGRGPAANSAVCFCLHVTEVNPDEIDLLFERFVSPERSEEHTSEHQPRQYLVCRLLHEKKKRTVKLRTSQADKRA